MGLLKNKKFLIAAGFMVAVLAALLLFYPAKGRVTAYIPVSVDLSKQVGSDGFMFSRYVEFGNVKTGQNSALEFDVYYEGDSFDTAAGYIELGQKGGSSVRWDASEIVFEKDRWTRVTLPLSGGISSADNLSMLVDGLPEGDAVVRMTNVRIVDQSVSPMSDIVGGSMSLSSVTDWQIIPHNSSFPTDDTAVARVHLGDVVNLADYNGTGLDMTAIITQQMAVISNKTHNSGNDGFGNNAGEYTGPMVGGTLYIPAGVYTVNGQLLIPFGVTVMGDWRTPADDNMKVEGTVLATNYGRGLQPDYSEGGNNTNAFIVMLPNSMIRNLSIWYPEQDPENIVPYRTTVHMFKAGNWGADYVHVRNITFVNSYHAVMQGPGGNGCPNVHNIYGTPLYCGVLMDGIGDVGRFDFMQFSPEYWENSGLPGAPVSAAAKQALREQLYNNATAFDLRRIDWSYLTYSSASGYNVGLRYAMSRQSPGPSRPNGQCYNLRFENCMNGIVMEEMAPNAGNLLAEIDMVNCYNGIVSIPTGNNGSASFTAARIDAVNNALQIDGQHRLYFTLSTINSGRIVSSGALSFTDCDFKNAAPQLILNEGGLGANLIGSRVGGNLGTPQIEKPDNMDVNVVPEAVGVKPPDILTPEAAFAREAKPAQAQLFVAQTGVWQGLTFDNNAHSNDNANDITDSLQELLNIAAQDGGGIVFLPPGHYNLSGTKSITIPTGVELKGAVDIGRNPVQIGTILNIYGGNTVDYANAGYTDKRIGDAAFVLSANSGIRGIVFTYPKNYTADFHTTGVRENLNQQGQHNGTYTYERKMTPHTLNQYPYAIEGNGSGIYAVNISLFNAFNGIDLMTNRCDDHYVQFLSGMAYNNFIRVGGGSVGGAIKNFQMNSGTLANGSETKNGAWIDKYSPEGRTYPNNVNILADPDNPNPPVMYDNRGAFWDEMIDVYVHREMVAFMIGDVKNQVMYDNFNWSGNKGMYFIKEDGQTGKSTGWSMGNAFDSTIVPMVFDTDVDIDLINGQVVSLRGKVPGISGNGFIYLTDGCKDEIHFYNNAFWGSGGDFYVRADGGTAKLYNNHLGDNLSGNVNTAALVSISGTGRAELYNGYIGPSDSMPVVRGNTNVSDRVRVMGFYTRNYGANSAFAASIGLVDWRGNRHYNGYAEPPSLNINPQGYLGAVVNNLHSLAVMNNTRFNNQNGVFVEKLPPASFAAGIGLRRYDVIDLVNGRSFSNARQFSEIIDGIPDGQNVILRVWRRTVNQSSGVSARDEYVQIEYTKGPDNELYTMPDVISIETAEQYWGNGGVSDNCQDTGGGRFNTAGVSGNYDWMHFKLYFTSTPTSISVRSAADGGQRTLTFRLGSPNGPVLFTAPGINNLNGWNNYSTTHSIGISPQNLPLDELIDVYVSCNSSINLNWFSFTGTQNLPSPPAYSGPNDGITPTPEIPSISNAVFSPSSLTSGGGSLTLNITGQNLTLMEGHLRVTVMSWGGAAVTEQGSFTVTGPTSAVLSGITIPPNNTGEDVYYVFNIKLGETVLHSANIMIPG
ncbi:MAG: carbohydrate-binding protein [Oscillospiraceae bacterium]|nr:carbohydrate-binding protein [Oscillospiraceae bacterium]